MWPDVRIIAGIEASMITSEGTCRLVMPLSESTIAMSGPSSSPCWTAALMASPSGSDETAESSAPRPSLAEMPAAARAPPYCSNSVGKNARTTWPKMIGSETFIIVALRCTENSTSSAVARAICSVGVASGGVTIMGGIYFEILQRIERRGYDVFSERVRVPKLQRARLALQIWALSQLSAFGLTRSARA